MKIRPVNGMDELILVGKGMVSQGLKVISVLGLSVLAILGVSDLSFGQCTGCTSTVNTNTNASYSANNQKICITSSTYSSNIDFSTGGYTNVSLCVASNVNWSGNTFTQGNNPTTIDLWGTSSYNFVGWNGLTSGVTLNIMPNASYTGQMKISNGAIINVQGLYNASSTDMTSSTQSLSNLNILSTGTVIFTPGNNTINSSINNQGTLIFNNTGMWTLNSVSTLAGNVTFNGSLTSNGQPVIVSGNVKINGDLTTNGNLIVLPGASISTSGYVQLQSNATIGGSIISGGNFQNTSPVIFQNTATMTVGGNFTVSNNATLDGSFNIAGAFNSTSPTIFQSSTSMSVGGNFTLQNSTTLAGAVNIGGNYNSTGAVTQNGGSTNISGSTTVQNNLTGGGTGGCGLFCPGGTFSNTGTISAGTGLNLCKSPTSGNSPGAGVGVFNASSTSQPTGLTIVSTSTGQLGSFVVATNTGTNGYMVVRRPNAQPVAPYSFTSYAVGSVVTGNTIVVAIISPRTVSSFVDTQPTICGTPYTYAAYAFQIATSTSSACGTQYFINTVSPATATFTISGLGSVGTVSGTTTVCTGTTQTYTTSTISGANGYIWRYSGTGATISGTSNTATVTFSGAATSGTLSVAGFSTCATTASALVNITITSAPSILSQPVSVTVCGGSSASFTVSTSGTGPTFSWQQSTNSGTSWTTISNGGIYSGATTSVLGLSGLSSSQSGYQFRALVGSGCGTTITSSSANLTINAIGSWLGTVNSDWSNASNWCGQPSLTTDNAVITSGVPFQPLISTSGVRIGGITIGSGASLSVSGSNTLTLSGNFINNGTLTPNSSSLFLAGTSTQVVSGTGVWLLNNVNSSNTVGLSILNSISVSGTVTLGTNAKVTAGSGASIVLFSNASGTARIASLPSGATISGNVTMQRYIPLKPTLRLMSSAVNGATINDWKASIPVSGIGGTANGFDASVANINTVWYFNETINAPTTYRYVGAPNTSMSLSVGAGYRVYVRGSRSTINLMGTITPSTVVMSVTNSVNQGTINFPVTYSNYNAPFRDGTNLVGNPYPCEINWDAAGWTKTNIDNAIYMWDPNLSTNGAYYYYVAGVASPARTNPGIIASSQAFFVKANAASPVLRATESVKTIAGHTANFRSSGEVDNVLRLNFSDSKNNVDETVVRLLPNAEVGFDGPYDAYKYYNSAFNIFQSPISGTDLAINAIDVPKEYTQIPLSVYSNTKGTHYLNMTGWEQWPTNVAVAISDAYTGTLYPMDSQNASAAFEITTDAKSQGNQRFTLVFARKEAITSVENSSLVKPKLNIYPNPANAGQFSIEVWNFADIEANANLINAAGVSVWESKIQANPVGVTRLYTEPIPTLAPGLYYIQIKGTGQPLSAKLVIID